MTDYETFLKSKQFQTRYDGFECDSINNALFDFQKDIVRWMLRKGTAAAFTNVGTGKTIMQLEYAQKMIEHTGKPALIVAPIAVNHQTQKMAKSVLNYSVHICSENTDIKPGINATNYEKLRHFKLHEVIPIFDESSIFKANGAFYKYALSNTIESKYLSCFSATPAPNDFAELGRHAEILKSMKYKEFLPTWFINDVKIGGMKSSAHWRLKGHSVSRFWDYISSIAVLMRNPADIGYQQDGYDLPPLNIIEHSVEFNETPKGFLFPIQVAGIQEERSINQKSLSKRLQKACEIIEEAKGNQVCVWCNLNAESDGLEKMLKGKAVNVEGKTTDAEKVNRLIGFADGIHQILITKPKIAGWGLNFQNCHNVIMFPSHSFEQLYQVIGRFRRYGQKNEVAMNLITTSVTGGITENLHRKIKQFELMQSEISERTKDVIHDNLIGKNNRIYYKPTIDVKIPTWIKEIK